MAKRRPTSPSALLLTPAQAAERLGISLTLVREYLADGRLPARRLGTRLRVTNAAVTAFVDALPAHVPGEPIDGDGK